MNLHAVCGHTRVVLLLWFGCPFFLDLVFYVCSRCGSQMWLEAWRLKENCTALRETRETKHPFPRDGGIHLVSFPFSRTDIIVFEPPCSLNLPGYPFDSIPQYGGFF